MMSSPRSPGHVLETLRLRLDEFEPKRDAGFLVELLNQRSFINNIRDTGTRTEADAERYVEVGPTASYARFGFGLWRVTLKESEEPVGMCGLVKRDDLEYPDLGLAYLDRHQRHGYGLEAGTAVLRHAREALSLTRILAIVAPQNAASLELLQKLGFRSDGLAPGGQSALLLLNDG